MGEKERKKEFLLALLPLSLSLSVCLFFPFFSSGQGYTDRVNSLGSEIAAGFLLSLLRRG